jgi:3-oxoacyl-[acyl-carrier protein] reductase
MVTRFARLSGDGSSLHTDPAFARRSPQREIVAHGMLPLLFLATLRFDEVLGGRFGFQRLACRFLKAVHPGDHLVLSATDVQIRKDGTTEVEFEITEANSGAVMTTGTSTLGKAAMGVTAPETDSNDSTLPAIRLEEQNRTWGEIRKGDTAGFEFRPTLATLQALGEILRLGGAEADWNGWHRQCDATHLLSSCVLSTMAGMCQPGRPARLLDLQIAFLRSLTLNQILGCRSTVTFKSETTMTMSQQIAFTDAAGAVQAEGRLHVQVIPPPVKMAGMAELGRSVLDLNFKGKTVLVTGASRGIGETTAKLFALHGANVVVNYLHNSTEAERVADECRTAGVQAIAVQADVADRAQVKAMVRAAGEHFGGVDILVNNAVRDIHAIPFLELSWEKMEQDLDVIVKGAFNCCQEVIPLMLARGGGKIINLSTRAVALPPPQLAKYVTAKSALEGLARSLAAEFAKDNIQVNVVAPNLVETDLTRQVGLIFKNQIKHQQPAGRLTTAAEVAQAIVKLAAPTSQATGITVTVEGGQATRFDP